MRLRKQIEEFEETGVEKPLSQAQSSSENLTVFNYAGHGTGRSESGTRRGRSWRSTKVLDQRLTGGFWEIQFKEFIHLFIASVR